MNDWNTSIALTASALFMGALGVLATFLPHEILRWLGTPGGAPVAVPLQVLGALYLGFAVMNWMARRAPVGGIYNRPLVLGNLLHFFSAAIALVRASVGPLPEPRLWLLAVPYAAFAACFAILIFRHPTRASNASISG